MGYLDYLKVKESPAELYTRKTALYSIFDKIGQELEMPESRYNEAEKRYTSVSDWLHECPVLGRFNPTMFAQGSFAIGTTVKALNNDEYDLDFIGHLQDAHPHHYTQQQVYELFLRRLKAHATYANMVEMMKRCVRIRYANEFHLDITPAVSNPNCSLGSLFVPDRKLGIWKDSHPKGYATWFKNIAVLQPRFSHLTKAFSEGRHIALGTTEAVPNQKAPRGVLRRAIQVMKRHRDTYKEKHPERADYAPISIIITTLAAHAYQLAVGQGEYDSEFDLMHAIINLMPQFIEGPDFRGAYTVKNPTNAGENFADKWQDPKYHLVFSEWHRAVQLDLMSLEKMHGSDELRKSLNSTLGGQEVDRVFSNQMAAITQARPQGQLSIPAPSRIGTTAAAALPIVRNNFFGQD
ncbi:nucleotidyltransferase domain-containing protein [Hymenobacter siberiensis]|uniref:nucleotidyltransferase domain-containing protein n=1 Tax=Hymenobacter siberiensis TaxID=2848396 RepID=UPI001C1DCEE5|nr:nucleotidyltransferase [Hymenobacter siberiensis]MBU6122608.1 nucleotidyltransferase [Hymenobacter siberiensis]